MSLSHDIISVVAVTSALFVSIHATLRRRNPHAANWWIVVSWTVPVIGPLFYLIFGINRVERKAVRLRRRLVAPPPSPSLILTDSIDETQLSPDTRELFALCRLVEKIVQRPLARGN